MEETAHRGSPIGGLPGLLGGPTLSGSLPAPGGGILGCWGGPTLRGSSNSVPGSSPLLLCPGSSPPLKAAAPATPILEPPQLQVYIRMDEHLFDTGFTFLFEHLHIGEFGFQVFVDDC